MRIPLTVLLVLTCIHSFKILVYIPKFAISHINFMGKIADTLVEAGNDVTALISEMDASLPDGTKKAKILRVSPADGANHMNTHFMEEGAAPVDIFAVDLYTYSGLIENAHHNSVSFCRQCRKLLTAPGLIEQLRNEKYDALITEDFDNCGVGLSHLISPRALIPVCSTMFFDPHEFGIYESLITESSALADGRFHSNLLSRMNSIYLRFATWAFYSTQEAPLDRLFNELFPGTPSISSLLSNAAVAFSNTDPLTDFARPIISKMIPIGGISVAQPKSLDKYWNNILSLRPQTVLVSFGSIAKSVFLTPTRKAALFKAFSSFPHTTFIWKYEDNTDEFARLNASTAPNVVLAEWMPQLDILADPRLSMFVSHAGMASCHEITHFGVPALLIPIFGDQVHNAAALAHIGVARVFSKLDMVNWEAIRVEIDDLLSHPRQEYQKKLQLKLIDAALRIRDQLAARPMSPAERLVKNVEFAARFGPSKSLRPLNLELSTIEFYGIDIAVIVVGSMGGFVFVLRERQSIVVKLIRFSKSSTSV
ncbi:hypothetical protein PRIPAC_81293 [Pristionchus pacificus]|uniref:glucuronosyltransferase n=1 Tax=Pristionchus pacificus TaxID=54126 RepID=A0A2A6CKU6_PRIPA|nr:hypothetical protein PRIPAC_81293 [Pristionchus pacificus]|eukprot:PDM78673.1 Glycosyltransferase [Pristionchus pacificus]